MATLTEVSYFARKGVNLAVILGIFFLILRTVFFFAVDTWQKTFPKPPPPPTVDFGKLPYPHAQTIIATPSALTYNLETIEGSLPVFPPSLKVYFMSSSSPSFGSFEKMKATAASLGFSSQPVKTGTTDYQFTDSDNPLRTLRIQQLSENFEMVYNYGSDLSIFKDKNFTSNSEVIAKARSFFPSTWPSDLEKGSANIIYLRLNGSVLETTTSLANSDAIGVTFDRGSLDKLPILSPEINRGLISVTISGSSDSKKQFLSARYLYTPIEKDNFATYPAIKSQEAYDFLKSGKAFYASLPPNLPKTITIRRVYLAYLDPYPSQNYLQPIAVFSDEKGFIAYVPVVSREWLQ